MFPTHHCTSWCRSTVRPLGPGLSNPTSPTSFLRSALPMASTTDDNTRDKRSVLRLNPCNYENNHLSWICLKGKISKQKSHSNTQIIHKWKYYISSDVASLSKLQVFWKSRSQSNPARGLGERCKLPPAWSGTELHAFLILSACYSPNVGFGVTKIEKKL